MKMVEKKKQAMSSVVRVKWIKNMRFVAADSMGALYREGASKQVGGDDSGISPVQLLLAA